MKLSTKGRYTVMAMAELAVGGPYKPMSLSELSERQKLPVQYLEQLFAKLRRAGLVKSIRGQLGGYILARSPDQIYIADIMQAVNEFGRITRCAPNSSTGCQGFQGRCLTHDLWEGLSHYMESYFKSITLEDVSRRKVMKIIQGRLGVLQHSIAEEKRSCL